MKPKITVKIDVTWILNEKDVSYLMKESQLLFVMHLESHIETKIRQQIRSQLKAIYVANGGGLDNKSFEVVSDPGDAAPIYKFGGA